jgi:undecaprenyl-diphosphatase
VSSSGHLVLVHAFFDGAQSWNERVILDVAVHVGTLFSVLVYFRRDVACMARGVLDWALGDFKSAGGRLNAHILVASVPVIVVGFSLHMMKPDWLLLVEVMAWSTIIFGVLLWVADRRAVTVERLEDMRLRDAVIIGLAQALALVPGTSRSGITMTAARFLGYSRSDAARFALLLAIIAIGGAGTLGAVELYESGDARLGLDVLLAAVISFFAGWGSIAVMMKWLEKASFTIFAVYRVILGVALLGLIYSGAYAL